MHTPFARCFRRDLAAAMACIALMWEAQANADPSPAPSSPPVVPSATEAPDFEGPGVPNLWYSLEEETSPDYTGEGGSSSQLNLRAQIPLGSLLGHFPTPIFAPKPFQLIKIKLPFVLSSPKQALQGAGDATVVILEYLGRKVRKWVVGPALKLPTASGTGLGSGKWSIGPAVGYTILGRRTEAGAFSQSFFSFAGPKANPRVSQTQIQPMYTVSFGRGWTLGTSQMQFTYNWQKNQWTTVPLGVRIADSFDMSTSRWTAGFEVEKNLVHELDTPGWTLRLNLRYRAKRQ
jgi:hypothetical protein